MKSLLDNALAVHTTSVSLSKLAKPRHEGGKIVEWVVRQRWLRKRERGVIFHYYATRVAALAAWPAANWP
jgi:hypothetical protein